MVRWWSQRKGDRTEGRRRGYEEEVHTEERREGTKGGGKEERKGRFLGVRKWLWVKTNIR